MLRKAPCAVLHSPGPLATTGWIVFPRYGLPSPHAPILGREAFVTLYERGLIHQGNYIINWCPRCQTALSDEESAHKEVKGGLYHIKYLVAGKGTKAERVGEDHIVIATTRPETMLGDTAVAVHPEDPRYKKLIGQKLILPLIEREIPIIADEFVDPEFGTGMVKVTPAHDPNDFEMGKRHDLEQINVMHPDGSINQNGKQYEGMDRFEARKKTKATGRDLYFLTLPRQVSEDGP